MWPFTKQINEDHIKAAIAKDPWMLYCAAGCKNNTLGHYISWERWWATANFKQSVRNRYLEMFPDDEPPSLDDIEHTTLRMIKGKYSEDFIKDGSVIKPGEERTISLNI